MNFDFIKNKHESLDGNILTITGDYEIDILSKIVKICGTADTRKGTVMYFNESNGRFETNIFVFKEA